VQKLLALCRWDGRFRLHGDPDWSCTTRCRGKLQYSCQRELRGSERALAAPLLEALRALALSPPTYVPLLLWLALLRSEVWHLHRTAAPPSASLALVIAIGGSFGLAPASPFFENFGRPPEPGADQEQFAPALADLALRWE
jgi:hypothetical protein